MPNYTRTQLKTSINNRIHGKIGMVVDQNGAINDVVRQVVGEVDMRSMKRRSSVVPNLFSDIYDYNCPEDLQDNKVIDFIPQDQSRSRTGEFSLTTEEEFDRRKGLQENLIAIAERDFIRKIRFAGQVSDYTKTISTLDSVNSGGGTWQGFGDGTNLTRDSFNYIKSPASIRWDINANGGTTAGIYNDSLDELDITDYYQNGSVFVWAYLSSATNVTNFVLRLGTTASHYYQITVTATNESATFQTGWNLLRFDMASKTTVGSPDVTAIDYCAIYMTKASGKVSELDYRFDSIQLKLGKIHYLLYYSKYPWQNTSGTYLENSTNDLDYINCDTEEYNLFIEKGVELIGAMVREYQDSDLASKKYEKAVERYQVLNPSEVKMLTTTYYDFASVDGDDDAPMWNNR